MLPNFIVIGAAKAGTTALYWYLAEHPSVFMSRVKETNYFAYGLDQNGQLLYGDPDVHQFPVKTRSAYEQLFADAGSAAAIGEASPIYLECPQAAGRIRDLLPDARLVCVLRQPVERAYSDYQMYLRARGCRLDAARDLSPDSAWARPDSRWMLVGRYHEQLARYYDLFPRSQIHVFLFDDLRRDAEAAVQGIYRFLGVDPAFVPDFDAPHNVGGMPSNLLLERFFKSGALRSAGSRPVPTAAANWVRRLRARNMKSAPALPAELRRELTAHFRDDIATNFRAHRQEPGSLALASKGFFIMIARQIVIAPGSVYARGPNDQVRFIERGPEGLWGQWQATAASAAVMVHGGDIVGLIGLDRRVSALQRAPMSTWSTWDLQANEIATAHLQGVGPALFARGNDGMVSYACKSAPSRRGAPGPT